MIKKLIIFAGIFLSIASWGQDNTASLYSYYGLGEVKLNGTQDAKLMGGLSITGDSIQLGLMNPASYSKLKLTTFAVGGTSTSAKFSTTDDNEKAKRTSFDYLAIGLPLGKFGVAFGLMPYSVVGYKNEETIISTNDTRYYRSNGDGYVNKVFLGSSYAFNKNINVGINFAYHFGDITNEFTERILEPDYTQYTTRERNVTELNGVSFNVGVLYNKALNKNLTLHSSLTYSSESSLSVNNSRNIATVVYSSNGTEFSNDSEDIAVPNNKLIIPSKLSLGFGLGENKKWLIGTELTFTQNKNLVNRFAESFPVGYENSTRFALGGYYIPKYDSFSNYFAKIVYRAGFKHENTGLVLNNESIKDYGMTFGLGLPIGFSRIDLGIEYGKRGTTSQGLIKEDYFNISVGLNLGAKWFERRKID